MAGKVAKDVYVYISIEVLQSAEGGEKRLGEVEKGFTRCATMASHLMRVQLGSKTRKDQERNMCAKPPTPVTGRDLNSQPFLASVSRAEELF